MDKLNKLVFVFVSFFITAHAIAQTHSLPAGWSLVGNDTGAGVDPVAVFGNATTPTSVSPSVTTVWTWNDSLGQWNLFAPSMTPSALATYAASKGYGVLHTIVKGEGFWVSANSTVSVNLGLTATSSNTTSSNSTSGHVSVIAGSATTNFTPVDGTGTAAVFWGGGHLVLDSSGNIIVNDRGVLRKVTQTGVVTTLNPNTSTYGSFWMDGLAIDSAGNFYGASNQVTPDSLWGTSLQEFTASGLLKDIAINWEASTTNVSVGSGGITIDGNGNLYLADGPNNRIVKFTQTGVMTVFAGSGTSGETDGIGTAATFTNPQDLAIDASGNIFVLDSNGNSGVIRKITANGTVSTILIPQDISIFPSAITVDQSDNIYAACFPSQIYRIDTSGNVTSLSIGTTDFVTGLTVDSNGNIYAITRGNGAQVLKISF